MHKALENADWVFFLFFFLLSHTWLNSSVNDQVEEVGQSCFDVFTWSLIDEPGVLQGEKKSQNISLIW